MTRVSYWWMRTNLTLKMMKLDDMCFLRHSYLHIVIHSGICWRSVWRVLFWHAGIEDNSWNYNYDVYTVQYDDKFWSGNTVKGIQAQQGWNWCIDMKLELLLKNCFLKCCAFSCLDWIGLKQTCLLFKSGFRYGKQINVFLLSWPASSFGEGGIKWR